MLSSIISYHDRLFLDMSRLQTMLNVPIKLQIPVEQVIYVDEPFGEKC